MKQRLGWMRDPALHLIAISTAVVGALLALNSGSWLSPAVAQAHPNDCHACSLCPPETAAARDAFLIRTGCIAPPDDAE